MCPQAALVVPTDVEHFLTCVRLDIPQVDAKGARKLERDPLLDQRTFEELLLSEDAAVVMNPFDCLEGVVEQCLYARYF